MTPTQLQDMDDIALCEYATAWTQNAPLPDDLPDLISELVERFRPYAKAPDAFAFPTHEEEPAL